METKKNVTSGSVRFVFGWDSGRGAEGAAGLLRVHVVLKVCLCVGILEEKSIYIYIFFAPMWSRAVVGEKTFDPLTADGRSALPRWQTVTTRLLSVEPDVLWRCQFASDELQVVDWLTV